MDVDEAMAVLAALQREHVEYVLVGALAMAMQGEIRATQDIDLFVAPFPGNVERLRAALSSVFEDPDIAEIASEDLGGEYSVMRYVPPSGDFAIDLISPPRRSLHLRGRPVGEDGTGGCNESALPPQTRCTR